MSENEGVRSECKKIGENSRQMAPVSTICDKYCRLILNFLCLLALIIHELGLGNKGNEIQPRLNQNYKPEIKFHL